MKAVASVYVMSRPVADAQFTRQQEIHSEVTAAGLDRGADALEPWLRPAWESADDDAQRMRVALDQVASLTDSSVEVWHRRFTDVSSLAVRIP